MKQKKPVYGYYNGKVEIFSAYLQDVNTIRLEVRDNGPGDIARVESRILEP